MWFRTDDRNLAGRPHVTHHHPRNTKCPATTRWNATSTEYIVAAGIAGEPDAPLFRSRGERPARRTRCGSKMLTALLCMNDCCWLSGPHRGSALDQHDLPHLAAAGALDALPTGLPTGSTSLSIGDRPSWSVCNPGPAPPD
jgi:hypothetical protein